MLAAGVLAAAAEISAKGACYCTDPSEVSSVTRAECAPARAKFRLKSPGVRLRTSYEFVL